MLVSLIFFASGIIISSIYAHQQHKDFVRGIQSRVNRNVIYRDYCGRLSLSDDCLTYTCTLVGQQVHCDDFSVYAKVAPDERRDITGSTETEALEGFYSYVDSLSPRLHIYDIFNEYTNVLNEAEKLGCHGVSALRLDLGDILRADNISSSDRHANRTYRP